MPTPVTLTIVSGLPRSGTSMMMKTLEAGGLPVLIDNIREADYDNPKGYYEFEPVKKTKEDPSWLEDADGKVVKMVYRLLYDLPPGNNYRIVFMQRKIEEVIASQNVMLSKREPNAPQLPDDKVAALFRAELQKVYDWIKTRPDFSVLYVDYGRMLGESETQIREIADFLGGDLNIEAMQAVVDPALYRNRR